MSVQNSVPGGQGSRWTSAGPSWGVGLLIVIGVGIAYGLAYSILQEGYTACYRNTRNCAREMAEQS